MEEQMTIASTPSQRANPGDMQASDVLARNWWAVAIRGIVAILFGVIALATPGAVLLSFALLFGAYLLVDGVFAIVSAVRAMGQRQHWGLLLAEGAVDILMGFIALLFPLGAVIGFVFATAAWSVVTGALMLGASLKLAHGYGSWWMMLSAVVSILFGIALLVAPLIGAVVLTWWLGGYAIAFGALLLVLSFKLRGGTAHAA
jgi:uncharacterized membrane protein HdeD (DUF308 family)